MRVWYKVHPSFVQCRIYMGPDPLKTMDKVGTLEIPTAQWDSFKSLLHGVQFIEDF